MKAKEMIKIISANTDFIFKRNNLLLFCILLVGSLFLLLTTKDHGIGITSDSITYIGCAENLIEGKIFIHKVPLATPTHYEDPNYYHEWAPLPPILLSGPLFFGIPSEFTALVINLLSFCMIAFIINRLLASIMKDQRFVILGTILAIISYPLYSDATQLMSETVFNLLVMASLGFMLMHVKGKNKIYLYASILFAGLACLTRYIGVTLVITSTLILLFNKVPLKKRIEETFIFGLFSSLPTVIFLGRNYILTGTLLGQRYGSERGLIENIIITYSEIEHWIIPSFFPKFIWVPLSLLISFIILLLIINIFFKFIRYGSHNNEHYLIFGLFITIYMAFLLFSASRVGFSKLGTRFISPIYAPALIIMILSLSDVYNDNKKKIAAFNINKHNLGRTIVSSIMVFWIIGSGICVFEAAEENMSIGTGVYSNEHWCSSDILYYVEHHEFDAQIFSNFPHQVYHFSRKDARYTPIKKVQGSSEIIDGFGLFNKSLKTEKAYIIWLLIEGEDKRDWLYDIEQTKQIYSLETYRTFPDGKIYLLSR